MSDFTVKSVDTIHVLPRGIDNPRNSEGDFARLKNGNILFGYCRYEGDSDHDDAKCNIAGLLSTDNGKTFHPLDRLLCDAADHGVINVMSVSFARLNDGTLCLFYLCKHTPLSEVYLRRMTDEDNIVFGEPELLVPQKEGTYYVINNCRICIADDGSVLIPAAEHPVIDGHASYYGECRIFGGDEHGRNFAPLSDSIVMPQVGHSETGLQEPGLVTLPDGRLYCYFRTDRAFQYESFSSDGGRTLTVPVQSEFTSPDSPMLIRRNPYSGLYYSIWNPVPNYNGRLEKNGRWINAGRTPFVIAESENGTDYSDFAVLEDEPSHGYCYPAVFFLSEKEMLLSYCCGGEEDRCCLTKTKIIKITLS